MKTIIPTTSLIERIIGPQKRVEGQRYRLMTYVVQQPVDDGVLLYNTLTCSLVLLTPDEAADITAQQELIDQWFLVPQEHDDRKACREIRQMAALLKPADQPIIDYTILTTTGCNARCFYCFEKGTKPVTMTGETASKVVRYIVAHRGNEQIGLHWFGGEPLVNVKAIDQICTELREQGVPFRSVMTSNGYLFDADKLQRAKNVWQLQRVNITLDGTAQTYNRVKDYVYRGVNAFERVLQNIGMLTAAGIDVRIRLNVDKHNIGEMADLVELLHQRFGTNEHLSIYSIDLYGERSPENNAELFEQKRQLDQQIAAYACGRNKQRLQKNIVPYFCGVDNCEIVTIAPDGHLSGCPHFISDEAFGHIDCVEHGKTVPRKFKEHFDDSEDCATCFYYPRCNRLVMCKDCNVCTPEKRQERLYEMKEAMKNEYEIYLDNANHHSGKTTD